MGKGNKAKYINSNTDEILDQFEQSSTTPTGYRYQSGTEGENLNSHLSNNIYSFVQNSLQNIVETHIASLKSNVAAYKKECKECQNQMHSVDKELANIKGEFKIIKILAGLCLTALIGNLIIIPIHYANVIAPELQELKTEIALLKNEKKAISSQKNKQQ